MDISAYGVPWNSFLYEEPLPVSWSERLDAMVKGVDSYELPVILTFSMNGNDKHSCPSSNASDYPGSTSPAETPVNTIPRVKIAKIHPIAIAVRRHRGAGATVRADVNSGHWTSDWPAHDVPFQ